MVWWWLSGHKFVICYLFPTLAQEMWNCIFSLSNKTVDKPSWTKLPNHCYWWQSVDLLNHFMRQHVIIINFKEHCLEQEDSAFCRRGPQSLLLLWQSRNRNIIFDAGRHERRWGWGSWCWPVLTGCWYCCYWVWAPAVQLTPPNLFLPHVRLMCYVTAVAVRPPPYHCYHFLKTLPRYNHPFNCPLWHYLPRSLWVSR